MLAGETMWITAKECIGLDGFPSDVSNIRSRLDKISTSETKRKRQGSKASEYHISLFSVESQVAIYKKLGKVKVGDLVLEIPKSNKNEIGYCRENLWERWNKTNTKAKDKAQETVRALHAVDALLQSGVARLKAYRAVAKEMEVSESTIRRAMRAVRGIEQCDWAPAVLPKYYEAAQTERTNKLASITDEAWEFFKADYLRVEQPSFNACYERLKDSAPYNGWTIPSSRSLRRRLELEVPKHQQIFFRQGEHALHQMYPPQERSVEDLHALQWINGDGYQHNVFVRWFNGEIIRPKTWFWADVYSRKIIGWRCDISENTDSIRLSFMDVCEKYGIPKKVTIDNTRAAANKWMTGGVANRYRFKVKADDPKGIMTMLVGEKNIHWTSVILGKGHGQAKPIERAFGIGGLDEYVDRDPRCEGAYTGPNPMAKPDNYGDKAIDAEEFIKVIAKGVELWNGKANRNTEICRGFMSFNEAFNASYENAPIRKATSQQLQMMMLQAEAVRVSRHGTITLDAGGSLGNGKNRYFHEAMYEYVGQKLVARFDPMKLHASVEIYTLNGVHVCTADCLEKQGFGDTKAAREHSRKRKQFVKASKEAAKAKEGMSAIELAEKMKPVEDDFVPEAKTVELFQPKAIGNTAIKAEHDEDEETSELEQNFQRNLLLLKQKRGDRL